MSDIFSRDWLKKEEAEAFIGKNSGFYLEKWKKYPNSFFKGWNWAAAIFRVEWMVYRKMYLEAAIVLIAVMALGIAVTLLVGPRYSDFASELFGLLAQSLLGFFANGLYRKKALRTLRKTGRIPESQRLPFLKNRGGTSVLAVIIFLILETALFFIPRMF